MFQDLTAKLIAAGVTALVLCVIIFLGYRHYTTLVQDLATSRENNAKLELAVEQQRAATKEAIAAVGEWKASQAKMIETMDRLNKATTEARDELEKTERVLAAHDLAKLAAAKPGLVARPVNAGTDAARRMLECASAPGGQCAH